ncbi:MAG: DinB family protein [Saprospiraceae bacterium]|nr:DinB family protein [Saprospiraceae bacterium]
MQRLAWTARTFQFDIPEGWIYNIMERLEGTGPRLKFMLQQITDDRASQKLDGKWSLKEHIGHLIDLEELHEGRIEDFLSGKQTLRAADMQNIKTEQADHNSNSIPELIENFNNTRKVFIQSLRKLDDVRMSFHSRHPRLKVPMKPVDMAYFVAEHDDHHLASMREILNNL